LCLVIVVLQNVVVFVFEKKTKVVTTSRENQFSSLEKID